MRTATWSMALAGCVAAALFVEWHTDEVTVVLALLLLSAIGLGVVRPDRAWFSGAILGFSILAAHALTEASGVLRPRYLHSPIPAGDWLAMGLLGVAITCVAWGGGAASTHARARTSASN